MGCAGIHGPRRRIHLPSFSVEVAPFHELTWGLRREVLGAAFSQPSRVEHAKPYQTTLIPRPPCLHCTSFLLPAQLREVGTGAPGPVKAPHLTAELISDSWTINPGLDSRCLDPDTGAWLACLPVNAPAPVKIDATATRKMVTLSVVTDKQKTSAEYHPLDNDTLPK
jgi:hypothetical protein